MEIQVPQKWTYLATFLLSVEKSWYMNNTRELSASCNLWIWSDTFYVYKKSQPCKWPFPKSWLNQDFGQIQLQVFGIHKFNHNIQEK